MKLAKMNFLTDVTTKPNYSTSGKKLVERCLSEIMNKYKVPEIPPLLVDDRFLIKCVDKTCLFNKSFLIQCEPNITTSMLQLSHYFLTRHYFIVKSKQI